MQIDNNEQAKYVAKKVHGGEIIMGVKLSKVHTRGKCE